MLFRNARALRSKQQRQLYDLKVWAVYMPTIPALRRLRQDTAFEARLGYT